MLNFLFDSCYHQVLDCLTQSPCGDVEIYTYLFFGLLFCLWRAFFIARLRLRAGPAGGLCPFMWRFFRHACLAWKNEQTRRTTPCSLQNCRTAENAQEVRVPLHACRTAEQLFSVFLARSRSVARSVLLAVLRCVFFRSSPFPIPHSSLRLLHVRWPLARLPMGFPAFLLATDRLFFASAVPSES